MSIIETKHIIVKKGMFNLKLIENNQEEQNDDNLNKKFDELSTKKIGRNEPCPCNSGKKYKHCHGAL